MSQREIHENGADSRVSVSCEDNGKKWTNPLEAGSSKLPPRPIDPSQSHSKRSHSPDRGERSAKRRSPGRDENGRRMEGYSQSSSSSKRRSRSPEERSSNRYSSKPEPGIYGSTPSKTTKSRDPSGRSWVSEEGHHSGGRDRREERDYAGYHGSSSASNRPRNEPRREDRDPTSRYEGSYNLEHRSHRMDSYQPGGLDSRDRYGSTGERRDGQRHREQGQSRDNHLDYSSRSSRSQRDESSRRHRHRTRSRSPATRKDQPEAEEGEIDDDWPDPNREVLPVSSERPSFRVNADLATNPSEEVSPSGSPYGHRPIKIKNRPTKRNSDVNVLADTSSSGPASGHNNHLDNDTNPPLPPPPPAKARSITPPPPAPSIPAPPPPVDRPPTPPPDPSHVTPKSTHTSKSNPLSPSFSGSSSQPHRGGPSNRTLEITKSQAKYDEHGDRTDGKTSVPHAPNRNLLNPNTRPTTPAAKFGTPGGRDTPTSKLFLRPTVEDEWNNLHKTFFGTTTLTAYDLGDKLGEGTFGVVTKGIEIATKRPIALKKLITHNPRDGVSVTTVREIKIIKSLNHPNVVEIIDMVVERKNHADRTQRGDVFMVFPYMDHDMCGLLSNSDFKLSHSVAKLLMRQILEGMDYIHANNYVHRDIKTANILVDREGGIKIADFGLARTWTFDEMMPRHLATEYTNMVVTRWYRAPELLLGDRHYGPAVDMWSIGCVLGEMYHRIPILQGETDRDQLFKIFGKLGRPSDESFPGWNKLPGFPDSIGYPWDKVPEDQPLEQTATKWGMDLSGINLMKQLLLLDPAKRLTANEALDHAWFWSPPKPANKAANLITVESSHEMTQRIKNDPPAMMRPKQQRPPPQHRLTQPQQAWNVPPPQHQQRHPMNGNGNGNGVGAPNPYAGANMNNPYAQQRPRVPFNNGPPIANYGNGPPNPAYGNGHGPPGMPMGGGMAGNGPYGGQHHGGMGRPPLGQFQGGPGQGMGAMPSRPPPHAGHSQSFNARPNFNSPGPGGPVRRNNPAPPSGFLLSGGGGGGGSNLPNLPKRPPTVMDAGKRREDPLPY